MRAFFAYLITAYRFSKAMRFTPEAADEKFWTEEDAKALENFLLSYTGAKLKMRLDNYALNSAQAAVKQKPHRQYEYDCGEANGIKLGIQSVYSHLKGFSPAQSESEQTEAEQAEGTLSDFEHAVP